MSIHCKSLPLFFMFLFFLFFNFDTMLFADEAENFLCTDLSGFPYCGASSYLQESADDWRKYHIINLFDQNKDTAWVEGASGDGIGEKVWFEIEPGMQELIILNGYAKNRNLFLLNNRVQKLDLQVWGGVNHSGSVTEMGTIFTAVPLSPVVPVNLQDTPERQSIPLTLNWKELEQKMDSFLSQENDINTYCYFLVLTIRTVYRGSKYRDTCIAEISYKRNPQYVGPNDLRVKDICGSWIVEEGSLWESIVLEAPSPFQKNWSSFLNGQSFDAGTWELGNGILKLVSEGGSDESYTFIRAKLQDGKLYLEDDTGARHVWQKE